MRERKLKTYRNRKRNMNEKLRYILLTTLIPMMLCLILILVAMGYYAYQYSRITHNVNVSSQFNLKFKEELDLKMYYYAIGKTDLSGTPIQDVDDAIKIAKSLQETTVRKESKQAIENMLSYCQNLKDSIYMLQQEQSYDERQIQLDNNIYVLTGLIQEKMQNYIYYEAGYLTNVESAMERNMILFAIGVTVLTVLTIAVLLKRALSFTKGITKPIQALCKNVSEVGKGNFEILDVSYQDREVELLNNGIQKMAKQIQQLLENVKEDEEQRHKMNLQLLQAQINPHFLYNTLDTIVWLVESGRSEDAINMLTQLSVFFRTSLSKGRDIITLEEEIMHTRSYLEIQQVRYRDIMDFSIELPEELKEIELPKLTIQPLAENALYHGVKEKRGKSSIHIRCEKTKNGIDIVVTDTGIGIKEDELVRLRHNLNTGGRVGFGLVAVQERIKLYFGKQYGLSIDSEYGKGTTITVHLA